MILPIISGSTSDLNSSLYMVKYEKEVFYLTKDFLSTLMSLKTEEVLLPKNTTPSDLSRLNSKYSNINGTPLNKM